MPDPLTDADLARLEALCAAATPGPWAQHVRRFGECDYSVGPAIPRADLHVGSDALRIDLRCRQRQVEADAEFICESHAALPALLAEVRALRRVIACRECDSVGHRDTPGGWTHCECGKEAILARMGEAKP